MSSRSAASPDKQAVFEATTSNRLLAADFVEQLDPSEWRADSLCAGWDVHTVAAHLLQPMLLGFGRFFVTSLRYRGDTDRVVDHVTRRLARRSAADVVRLLREHAADQVSPPRVGPMGPFAETCLHLHDIAIPLGRDVELPVEHGEMLMSYLVSPAVVPALVPPGRLTGLRWVATDSPWTHGSGPEVTGPVTTLALAATGRAVALHRLTGPGVELLRSRLKAAVGRG